MVNLLYLLRLMDLSLGKAALMAGTYLNSGSKARTLKRLFSVESMRRFFCATRPATIEPTLKRTGTLASPATTRIAAFTGCCCTLSRRRTSVARCSCAESSTSSRRRCRISISVTGSSHAVAQRLLIALQHGDRFLEKRRAGPGGLHQV